jgi:sporulation protein YqfC
MNHGKTKAPKRLGGRGAGERPSRAEWLAVKLDIPADVTGGGLRVDLRGRNNLTVHGCRRILDFSPCEIKLEMEDAILTVCGCRLICTAYLADAVGVDGYVCSLTFADKEGQS